MKVELNDIALGISPLTDRCFAGVSKDMGGGNRMWKHKIDVTNDFLQAVIVRWAGCTENITDPDGNKYKITVEKLNK